MPTVSVTDVVVRTRKVRLPAACPNCGGRLNEDEALRVRGFADEMRWGRLARPDDNALDAVAGIVLGDGLPDSAETFIDHVTVLCSRCNRTLAKGEFTVKPGR
jgi:hypothetical protein